MSDASTTQRKDYFVTRMAAKESFEDTYSEAEPTCYYSRYADTRLSVVEYIADLVRLAVEQGLTRGPVVDIGCGYGTLGALLRSGLDVEGVYRAYLSGEGLALPRDATHSPRIRGVDRSRQALSAAKRSGLIDQSIRMDLSNPAFAPLPGSVVTCSAVLGYVHPTAIRIAIEQLHAPIAIVTCVTWLMREFDEAFAASP